MYIGYVCGRMQFKISKLELKIQTFLHGPKLNFLSKKLQIMFLPKSSTHISNSSNTFKKINHATQCVDIKTHV